MIDASSVEIHVQSGDFLVMRKWNVYREWLSAHFMFKKAVVSGGKTVYQKMLNKKDGYKEEKKRW